MKGDPNDTCSLLDFTHFENLFTNYKSYWLIYIG